MIITAACMDECYRKLSSDCKTWFGNMGSKLIWRLGYRKSFAFIGVLGKKDPIEDLGIRCKSVATV